MPKTTLEPLNRYIHQLQHQAVRDLAWCCFSPPMMRELPDSDAVILPIKNDELWPWLVALDKQPEALIKQIAQVKSTRLGIYYETLWRFYFSQHPDWELLQHNLQIGHKGITLGAFDFLCRHKNDYWHIETAVKFYLCDTTTSDDAHKWQHWIGPNSQDRLDLKLVHLRQHQLPLHKTIEGVAHLHTQYPNVRKWQTGLCMQGYLFSAVSTDYSPTFSNENHGRGYWRYLSDFLQHQQKHTDTSWVILERQRWLSPAHVEDEQELLQGEKLTRQLQQQVGEMKRPLLLAAVKKTNQTENYWCEDWREFVVPDHWPEKGEIP